MRSFIVGCLTLLVMSGCSATVSDDTVTLLPLPREVVWNKGVFDSRSVSLSGDFSVTGAVREWLEESGIESSGMAFAVVEVALVDRIDKAAVNQDEAYRLIVAPKSIRVEAVSETVCSGLSRRCGNWMKGRDRVSGFLAATSRTGRRSKSEASCTTPGARSSVRRS